MTDQEHKNVSDCIIAVIIIGLFLIIVLTADAQIMQSVSIDLDKIAMIESSGNPLAWNKKTDSRGIYQITKNALSDWNIFSKGQKYTMDDLWNASISSEIADWYLNKRIPQMLRYFKKPVTTRNIIVSYNAGIDYVVKNKQLPKATKDYLKKYNRR